MITIASADSALKDYYLSAVNAQLNDGISPFFAAIEKSSENVFGREARLAVVRGYSGNVMAGDEDGDLPDPYKNRYISISVPLKNLYGRIEITDKAIRASRDSAGAFVSLLNAETEGLIASARQNFQRMLFGDGTGKLCSVSEALTETDAAASPVKEYFTGMQVDAYNLGGSLVTGGTTYIKSVDTKEGIVSFTDGIEADISNGALYVHGCKDNELTGLGAIFDSDTLYGYDKSSDPYFRPYISDCGGTLTESMLSDVLDYMEENFGSRINMILCSYSTRKLIASLIDANRRVVNSIDVRTGYGAVTVNDVPVYADKYCPDGRILFVNTDDFRLCQLCDWEWLESEDGKILRQTAGKAAYTATLVKYAELVCSKPCGQAMLTNIS